MSLVPERFNRHARKIFTDRLVEYAAANNPLLARALHAVDRAAFIPPALKHLRALAYQDKVITLEEGSSMTQPSLIVKMLKNLYLEKGQRVLEIGTASGYQAALLAEIVGKNGEVHTVEINHKLAEHAKKKLKKYPNVTVHEADGSLGLPDLEQFDRIIVTAQGTEVPIELRNQLRIGGYLIMPVGNPELQHLIVLQKLSDDDWYAETLSGAVRFVTLQQSERTTRRNNSAEI